MFASTAGMDEDPEAMPVVNASPVTPVLPEPSPRC